MGMNVVFLKGRLGNDPEVIKNDESGKEFVRFNMATNDEYAGQKKPEWHKIIAYGKYGEVCKKYMKKGMQVLIQGRNQTRSYEKNGQTHYITEVIVTHKMDFNYKD